MAKTAAKPVEEMTYEEAYSELEGVVGSLEGGQPSLEQAMALFERGQALVRHCRQLLEQAELRVRQLDVAAGEERGENGPEDAPGAA